MRLGFNAGQPPAERPGTSCFPENGSLTWRGWRSSSSAHAHWMAQARQRGASRDGFLEADGQTLAGMVSADSSVRGVVGGGLLEVYQLLP